MATTPPTPAPGSVDELLADDPYYIAYTAWFTSLTPDQRAAHDRVNSILLRALQVPSAVNLLSWLDMGIMDFALIVRDLNTLMTDEQAAKAIAAVFPPGWDRDLP